MNGRSCMGCNAIFPIDMTENRKFWNTLFARLWRWLFTRLWRWLFSRQDVHLLSLLSSLGIIGKIPNAGKYSHKCRSAALGQVGKPELLLRLRAETEIAMKGAWSQSFGGFPFPVLQGCLALYFSITKHGVSHQQTTAAGPWEMTIYSSISTKIICVSADIIHQAVFSKTTVLWTAEVGRSQNSVKGNYPLRPAAALSHPSFTNTLLSISVCCRLACERSLTTRSRL